MHGLTARLPLLAVAMLFSVVVAGCDREPRIDATTEQTTEESIEHIVSLMSDEDAETFQDAIGVLVMHEMVVALEEGDIGAVERDQRFNQRLRDRLHNRTASEVVDQVMQIAQDYDDEVDLPGMDVPNGGR